MSKLYHFFQFFSACLATPPLNEVQGHHQNQSLLFLWKKPNTYRATFQDVQIRSARSIILFLGHRWFSNHWQRASYEENHQVHSKWAWYHQNRRAKWKWENRSHPPFVEGIEEEICLHWLLHYELKKGTREIRKNCCFRQLRRARKSSENWRQNLDSSVRFKLWVLLGRVWRPRSIIYFKKAWYRVHQSLANREWFSKEMRGIWFILWKIISFYWSELNTVKQSFQKSP